jgi:UDP-glucose 4-epimerase
MTDGPTGQRILVTGGAGFIGSHLAEALVADNEVTVVDDLSAGDRSNVPDGARFVEADVRDDALVDIVADVDCIFHEAAQISVDQSVADPSASQDRNVAGTLAVLEAAREADARVVLASSCAIYGHPDTVPTPEDAPTTPTSPYGLEKLTVDHYARLYHDLYGLETVALRYFNVYGPRAGGEYAGVVDVFLDQALAGDPLTVHGDGTQTRDFVHITDVVRANLLAATTEGVGASYNVGTGQECSIADLADVCREVVGADVPIEHTDPRTGDVERSCADTEKVDEGLGFEAQVSLSEGLDALVQKRRKQ